MVRQVTGRPPEAVGQLFPTLMIIVFCSCVPCPALPPQYSSPVKEKLLLDCPLPPGALPPPTLVLDLEGTLLGTIYTRKKG